MAMRFYKKIDLFGALNIFIRYMLLWLIFLNNFWDLLVKILASPIFFMRCDISTWVLWEFCWVDTWVGAHGYHVSTRALAQQRRRCGAQPDGEADDCEGPLLNLVFSSLLGGTLGDLGRKPTSLEHRHVFFRGWTFRNQLYIVFFSRNPRYIDEPDPVGNPRYITFS